MVRRWSKNHVECQGCQRAEIKVRPPIVKLSAQECLELKSPDHVLCCGNPFSVWGMMNGDTRDLVSAMLAIGYAAFLLMLGELYITSRSTELPAISLKQSGSMSRALHAIAAD